MAVTETKTGAWYGIGLYGTSQYTTASNTLALDESVSATALFTGGVTPSNTLDFSLVSGAAVSATQAKFGSQSLLLDGVDDHLASTSSYDLSTDDFTVETWFYQDTSISGGTIFSLNDAPLLTISSTNIFLSYSGGTWINVAHGLTADTWHHIALSREGDVFRVFVDGTELNERDVSPFTVGSTSGTVYVGRNSGGSNPLGAYLDDFRFSDVCRYTESFTAPTAPHQPDTNTVTLLHFEDGVANDVTSFFAVTEGTGVTFTLPSVSATGVAVDVDAYMAFTTTSTSAALVVNADTTDFFDGFRVNTNFVNAYYGQGIYGASYYGDVSAPTEFRVPSVTALGDVQLGGFAIIADNNTEISVGVFGEIVTDAPGVVGDEVEIVAKAVVTPESATGAAEIDDVEQRTENTIIVADQALTATANPPDVAADANFTPESATGTGEVTTVNVQAVYLVPSVSATGTVDEDEIVGNNAIPSIGTAVATGSPGNVTISTTTVIFNAVNKDHERTTYFEPDKPRIVYVRAA